MDKKPFIILYGIISEKDTQKKTDALEWLLTANNCVILGEAGAGKTTLAEQWELETGKKITSIPLSHYDQHNNLNTLVSKLYGKSISEIGKGFTEEIFFLDGFNEVNPTYRNLCKLEIKNLINQYPDYKFFITCRTQNYTNDFTGLPILTILPLNYEQIEHYFVNILASSIDFLNEIKLMYQKVEQIGLLKPIFINFLLEFYEKYKILPSNHRELMERFLEFRLDPSGEANPVVSELPYFYTEIAYLLQENSCIALDISMARERVLKLFVAKGRETILGYDGNKLWNGLIKYGFIRQTGRKIQFDHEIWQEYFVSLKLCQILEKPGDTEIEFIKDSWWNDSILYTLPYLAAERIEYLLELALKTGNKDLVGYALRREAGLQANNKARLIVDSMLKSEESEQRVNAVKLLGMAGVETWSVKTLLYAMDQERRKYLYSCNEVENQAEQILGRIPWISHLPLDVIYEISDMKDLLPDTQAEIIKLLQGAVGVIPHENIIEILKEKLINTTPAICFAIMDVIERLSFKRLDDRCKEEITKILEMFMENKELLVSQTACELLVQYGYVTIPEDLIEIEVEKIISDANKAILKNDPICAYKLFSYRYEEIIGETYYKAWERIEDTKKLFLLRLIINNVIDDRKKLKKSKEALINREDIGQQIIRLEDLYPEDSEIRYFVMEFHYVINAFLDLATYDDLKILLELLIEPFDCQTYPQTPQKILWYAAKAILKIDHDKSKQIIEDVIKGEHHIKAILTAGLAYTLGIQKYKWSNASYNYQIIWRKLFKLEKTEILKLLKHLPECLNPFEEEEKNLGTEFYKKLGYSKIRELALSTLKIEPECSLNFLKNCAMPEDIPEIRHILQNPAFSEVHNLAKDVLKSIEPGIKIPEITLKQKNLMEQTETLAARFKHSLSQIDKPYPESPSEETEYNKILEVIENIVTVMERNPESFETLDEPALRDHILVQLNGQYKGKATGETSNGRGKTDILIRHEGKNIFIAECKFWRGKKVLRDTIDQLLSYTTWRDTKTAIILFNKNLNLSQVLQKISETVPQHACFVRDLCKQNETHFRYLFHHPDDKEREIFVAVLVFDVPSDK